MAGSLAPAPWYQFLNDEGNPLVGGLLYTYLAGTSTPAATYQDVDLTVPHANPVVLDAAGRATLYLGRESLKFTLRTALGVLVRTQDNVVPTQAGFGLPAEIFVFGGDASSNIIAVAYPAGATFDKCHAGSAFLLIDSADLVGNFALEAMMMSTGGVTVTVGLFNLTDAPNAAIVELTSTHVTGERKISAPIVFPAGGVAKQYGIKVKVSSAAGAGFVWGVRLSQL